MLGIKIQIIAEKNGVEICNLFNLFLGLPCVISFSSRLGMYTGESERLGKENAFKRTRVFDCINLQCVRFFKKYMGCLHPKTC